MPSIVNVVKRFTKQDMLYWQKVGSDSFGKPQYATPLNPTPLKCRWEDKQQEIVLPDGRKVLSKGYLLLTTPLVVGSLVFLGTLAVWQAMPGYPTVPTNIQGGREVLLLKTTPDLKNTGSIYEAYL